MNKLFLFFLFLCSASYAQTTSVKLLQQEVSGQNSSTLSLPSNPKFKDESDVTSPRLKAEAGSLSQYSIKTSLIYLGPGISDWSGRDRPNPDHQVGAFATSLGGAISGRYRLTGHSALSFGTGINALHPMNGFDRLDTRTPFLGYDFTKRLSDFQTRLSLESFKTTIPENLDVAQTGGFTFGSSFVYDVGYSKISLGLDTKLTYYVYGRDYIPPKDKKHPNDGNAVTYSLGVTPSFTYNFSDKLNMSTSFPLSYQNLRRAKDSTILKTMQLIQNIGLTYSFSRDVIISPFINFYPNNFVAETTTLNVATIFSVL
ncbi:MAG: hypothetical protein ACXVCY_00185 [Pseudobdellovibrionaceae bacterium]